MLRAVQRFRLDRIPDNLLREPLEFLGADHIRQRKVCSALDTLFPDGNGGCDEEISRTIRAYLTVDLPLHISDEEVDLFPSLRAAGRTEDNIASLIDGLTRDHATELSIAGTIATVLGQTGQPPAENDNGLSASRLFAAFTECVRRHLAIEEQTLLPLARKRLSHADLARIGRGMAQRRNIDYPD